MATLSLEILLSSRIKVPSKSVTYNVFITASLTLSAINSSLFHLILFYPKRLKFSTLFIFLCARVSKGNMSASISIYFSIIIYIDRRGILLYSIYRPKNI